MANDVRLSMDEETRAAYDRSMRAYDGRRRFADLALYNEADFVFNKPAMEAEVLGVEEMRALSREAIAREESGRDDAAGAGERLHRNAETMRELYRVPSHRVPDGGLPSHFGFTYGSLMSGLVTSVVDTVREHPHDRAAWRDGVVEAIDVVRLFNDTFINACVMDIVDDYMSCPGLTDGPSARTTAESLAGEMGDLFDAFRAVAPGMCENLPDDRQLLDACKRWCERGLGSVSLREFGVGVPIGDSHGSAKANTWAQDVVDRLRPDDWTWLLADVGRWQGASRDIVDSVKQMREGYRSMTFRDLVSKPESEWGVHVAAAAGSAFLDEWSCGDDDHRHYLIELVAPVLAEQELERMGRKFVPESVVRRAVKGEWADELDRAMEACLEGTGRSMEMWTQDEYDIVDRPGPDMPWARADEPGDDYSWQMSL